MAKKDKNKKKNHQSASDKVAETSGKIEKQFDSAMEDTQEFLDKKVGKKTKKTASNVSKKAEAFAGSVEHFGEEIDEFTNRIFPASKGSRAVFNAGFDKKVSRLFIFRFLWCILQGPIIAIWSIWIGIITIIHWISMFIFGKRSKHLWVKQLRFWKHVIARKAYFNALTDERPPLIYPEVKEKK